MPDLSAILEQYNDLPKDERDEIDRLLTKDVRDEPWRPLVNVNQPEHKTPQQQAYESEADIVLFGGAAGGGKSSLLIGLALREGDANFSRGPMGCQILGTLDRQRSFKTCFARGTPLVYFRQ
jgi:hypothetical protein